MRYLFASVLEQRAGRAFHADRGCTRPIKLDDSAWLFEPTFDDGCESPAATSAGVTAS